MLFPASPWLGVCGVYVGGAGGREGGVRKTCRPNHPSVSGEACCLFFVFEKRNTLYLQLFLPRGRRLSVSSC